MEPARRLQRVSDIASRVALAALLWVTPTKAVAQDFDPLDYRARFARVQADLHRAQKALHQLKEFEDLPVEEGDSLWGMTAYAERMADRIVFSLGYNMITPLVGKPPEGTSDAEIASSVQKTLAYHAYPTPNLIHADERVAAQHGTRTSFNVSFTTRDEKTYLEEVQSELQQRLRNLLLWQENEPLIAQANLYTNQ